MHALEFFSMSQCLGYPDDLAMAKLGGLVMPGMPWRGMAITRVRRRSFAELLVYDGAALQHVFVFASVIIR